jgi:hypothetical protein
MVVPFALALTVSAATTPFLPPPIPIPPEVAASFVRGPLDGGPAKILYVNFDGAPLHGGDCSDSASGCSFIIKDQSGRPITVNFPPFGGTAAAKQNILNLVKQYYAPFNVDVVTTRPAAEPYSMIMVGPGAAVIPSIPAGAAGVAPLDCGDQNGSDVSFAFTDVVNASTDIAVTVAQESAHGYGLGHTNNPQDIMYPVVSHMEMAFLDATMMIPDGSGCEGNVQNSHQLLAQNVGLRPQGPDTTPPDIGFIAPVDGAEVPSGFHIEFAASDDRGVTHVDVLLDGNELGGTDHMPWSFDVPGGLVPAGMHRLKGVAKDAAGNQKQSAEISVKVKALGDSPGDLGSACTVDADCPGGLCAFDSGASRHFCTRLCDPAAMPSACPIGFACVDAGGPKVCAANSGGGSKGGGCSVGALAGRDRAGSPLLASLLVGLGVFAIVLVRRRRGR